MEAEYKHVNRTCYEEVQCTFIYLFIYLFIFLSSFESIGETFEPRYEVDKCKYHIKGKRNGAVHEIITHCFMI